MDYVRPLESLFPDATGRILASLARVDEEFTLRTLSRVSGVSPNQVSKIVARLVALRVVERRDVPPAALVRLSPTNEAARLIGSLVGYRDRILDAMRRSARLIKPAPASLVVFGSFARGTAGPDSDLDVVAIRAGTTAAEADEWSESLARWTAAITAAAGNPVAILEYGLNEALDALTPPRSRLWEAILTEGLVVAGTHPGELADVTC